MSWKYHLFYEGVMRNLIFVLLLISCLNFAQGVLETLNMPGAGNINQLFAVNDSIILAGIQKAQVYRSTDAGKTWAPTITNQPNPYSNTGVNFIFKTRDGAILVSVFGRGLYRSIDKGLTWQFREYFQTTDAITQLDNGLIFCDDGYAYSETIYYSMNSGQSWQEISKPITRPVHAINSIENKLFIFLESRFCGYSEDNGATWVQFQNNPQTNNYDIVYDILPLSKDKIIITTYDGVFKTSDNGLSWQAINNGFDSGPFYSSDIQEQDNKIYVTTSKGVYFTENEGGYWQPLNLSRIGYETNSLCFTADKILCGTDIGIFKISETEWEYSSDGIYASTPVELLASSDGFLYYDSEMGIFRYNIADDKWKRLDEAIFYQGAKKMAQKGSSVIAWNYYQHYYYSTDHGDNWLDKGKMEGPPTFLDFSVRSDRIYMTRYDRYSSYIIDGLWYSDNLGANWKQGSGIPGVFDVELVSGVNRGNDTLVLFGGQRYTNQKWGVWGVYSATGEFVNMNAGLQDTISVVLGVDNHLGLYAANSLGLFRWGDIDNRWHLFYPGLTNITDIKVSPSNVITIVQNGALKYFNDMDEPVQITEGLASKPALITFDMDNYLFVAGEMGKMYRLSTPLTMNPTPVVPELKTPLENAEINSASVVFDWEKSTPQISEYCVQISKNFNFIEFDEYRVNADSISLSEFESLTDYYWRVKSVNFSGESDYSEVRHFKFLDPLGVNENPGIDYKFSLEQNYPNPFNPGTNILFSLAEAADVTISIYNMLGEKIFTEKPGLLNRGEHDVAINMMDKPSGVYIYQLHVKTSSGMNKVFSKKMLLLK